MEKDMRNEGQQRRKEKSDNGIELFFFSESTLRCASFFSDSSDTKTKYCAEDKKGSLWAVSIVKFIKIIVAAGSKNSKEPLSDENISKFSPVYISTNADSGVSCEKQCYSW